MCSIFKLDPACVVVLTPYLLYEMILCEYFNGLGDVFFLHGLLSMQVHLFLLLYGNLFECGRSYLLGKLLVLIITKHFEMFPWSLTRSNRCYMHTVVLHSQMQIFINSNHVKFL